MRLDAFLAANRDAVIERCRLKVSARRVPRGVQRERGLPLFVDQMLEMIRLHIANDPANGGPAARHGFDRMEQGFTIAQLVHDYGDLAQAITELAIEQQAPLSNEDYGVLARCFDQAVADAVTEFSRAHDVGLTSQGNERLGILAHEVRNLLTAATLTFGVLKSGRVDLRGATGALHELSLGRLRSIIDRSLASVRLDAGTIHPERVEVSRLLEEIEISAALDAEAHGVVLSVVLPSEPGIAVEADPQILSAVVFNVTQNAVKFTRPQGHVAVTAHATPDQVAIEISDECGGLPPGTAENLFRAFEQRSTDRTGLGLGLTIARRGVEANGGELHVRDVPGSGCVFTVALPRAP
jgi:signal transduction histidine kinase